MMTPPKAISLWQPYASALASGVKTIETRSRNTHFRGRVLIHSSTTRPTKSELEIYNHDPGYKNIRSHFPDLSVLPRGYIVGSVEVVSVNYTHELAKHISNTELDFGDYRTGRYGWICKNPVLFKEPVKAKGQLGIWGVRNRGAFKVEPVAAIIPHSGNPNYNLKYYGQVVSTHAAESTAQNIVSNYFAGVLTDKDIFLNTLTAIEKNIFQL